MLFPHQFFKLLSDETRLRCLLLIAREKRLCVNQLTTALNESQPKISRHLAQLRQLGVLIDTREGQWIFYQINSELPGWLNKIIDGLIHSKCLQIQYQIDNDRLNRLKNCC